MCLSVFTGNSFSAKTQVKMSRVLLFVSLLGVSLATPYEIQPLSDEEISFINTIQSSWKAGRNFDPEELDRVQGLLGVDIKGNMELVRKMPHSNVPIRNDLPKEFDPRKKWPQCKSLSEIRDQSACGSCWAFGPSEAMTDRTCIHTNKTVHISAEDVVDCCADCGAGCYGGYPSKAWAYYQKNGIVSGGNYNSSEGCMPYSLPNCDHHIKGKYKPCGDIIPTPTCHKKCRQGYPKTYEQDKHHGTKAIYYKTVEQIMQELVDNGPASAVLNVYSDLFNYKSGVYKHTTGKLLGAHAVKILGYGVEGGKDYWLVANSWNEDWGDKGYFKIVKGSNDCGIEDSVIAGLPKA